MISDYPVQGEAGPPWHVDGFRQSGRRSGKCPIIKNERALDQRGQGTADDKSLRRAPSTKFAAAANWWRRLNVPGPLNTVSITREDRLSACDRPILPGINEEAKIRGEIITVTRH